MNKQAQSEEPSYDLSDFLPNPIRLSDDLLDELERQGHICLEERHRRWLRNTLPLDVHLQPARSAEGSPRLKREREARLRRLAEIAELANRLSEKITEEIGDRSHAGPSLYGNLSHVDAQANLSVLAGAVSKIELAALFNPAPTRKSQGRWSPYAPYKDFVLQFAEIYRDAGGTPSSGWSEHRGDRRTAFWRAFEVINRELPDGVRVDVDGLAEHAHRSRWFRTPATGAKPTRS